MEEVANLRDPSVMQAQAMRDLAMQLHRACIKFDIVLESYPGTMKMCLLGMTAVIEIEAWIGSTPNFGERIECYGTQARFQKQLRFESSAPSRKRRNPPPLEKPTGKDFDFIQREMCKFISLSKCRLPYWRVDIICNRSKRCNCVNCIGGVLS